MQSNTLISIIIPTYNNYQLLENAILSIMHGKSSKINFEILVIDNCSTDDTKNVTLNLITQYPDITIKYCYEPVPGLLSARHKGAEIAQGEILVYIDDDVEVSHEWLKSIKESFDDQNVHLVGGRSLPKFEISPPYWFETLWDRNSERIVCGYYSLIDAGEYVKFINPNYVFGLNFAIRKKTLYDLGGFHPDCIPQFLQRFQGDGETGLTIKLKEKALKALYNPKALVYHFIRKDRLTIEFLEKRMFYQGVSTSYTTIRRNNGLNRNSFKHLALKYLDLTYIIKNIKNMLILCMYPFKKKNKKYSVIEKKELKKINVRMKIVYLKGFNFHQREVKKDPALLEWVLKRDYFDYKLPITF